MLSKEMIKALAAAERMMDKGEIPYVRMIASNGKYERMAVSQRIMEELGLEQGQTINTIIQDAIAEMSMKILSDSLNEIIQDIQDKELDENFDFRTMMGDNDDNDNL